MRQKAKEMDLPPRLIVVADSDCSTPDQQLSGKPKEIQEKSAEHGISCVIFSKREGENYLPDFHWQTELQRDPTNQKWISPINKLISMSVLERNYCDMEQERLKKVPACYDKNKARPYHLEVLLQRVCQAQGQPEILCKMADDLLKRDHTGDLTAILELIEQER